MNGPRWRQSGDVSGREWRVGDCVRVPDGRLGRVRGRSAGKVRVRVRRKTSRTHQFLELEPRELQAVECPKGWMSADGYRRYMRAIGAKRAK